MSDKDYLTTQEDELKRLARVCVGNSVYVQKLRQLVRGEQAATGTAEIDLDTHSEYCTIKLS